MADEMGVKCLGVVKCSTREPSKTQYGGHTQMYAKIAKCRCLCMQQLIHSSIKPIHVFVQAISLVVDNLASESFRLQQDVFQEDGDVLSEFMASCHQISGKCSDVGDQKDKDWFSCLSTTPFNCRHVFTVSQRTTWCKTTWIAILHHYRPA